MMGRSTVDNEEKLLFIASDFYDFSGQFSVDFLEALLDANCRMEFL